MYVFCFNNQKIINNNNKLKMGFLGLNGYQWIEATTGLFMFALILGYVRNTMVGQNESMSTYSIWVTAILYFVFFVLVFFDFVLYLFFSSSIILLAQIKSP